MNKSQRKLSAWQKNIGKTLKGIGVIFGGIAIGKFIKDSIMGAARTEALNVAMQSVAKSSGYMLAAVQADKKAVMELGIAEQEATQILNRFMQAQLDTADAAKLARVAQDAAVIAGMDSSQAAEQMTEAIAKQRPILLSAFGMTKNMNEIYKDHATTLGKTAKQLTTAEKKQAMLNHILKEGEKIAGTYEASMGAVGKQIGSLPRYWQTLQNAIAKPLMLPGLGEAVEGITNALKGAISWAEANKETLQRWGQSIAGVVRTAVKGFSLITDTIAEHWQTLKFVATTLITYTAITKGAAAATTAWRLATLALKGELMTKVPVLTTLSAAIGTYRLQMALAPVPTNIFTAALLRLRVALYAVHAALGPIGWAILGISALVSGGMSLWNKYNQSLQKTASLGFGDFGAAQAGLADSTADAADAAEDQAEAIDKAGKAAGKNLQSFDEVHQIMEDTAGAAGDAAGQMDMPSLDAPGVSGLDMGDLMADLEGVKPTLKGFWEWLKQGAGNAWEGVKEKWGSFWDWVKGWGLWEWFADKWAGTKKWAGNAWDGAKEKWEAFKSWAADWAARVWKGIKDKWGGLKTWAGDIWDDIKDKWNGFKAWVKSWAGPLWDSVKQKWAGFKVWLGDMWTGFAAVTKDTWAAIKTFLGDTWGAIKTTAGDVWSWITETITEHTLAAWDWLVEAWGDIGVWLSEAWKWLTETADETWGWITENITAHVQSAWDWLVITWNIISSWISGVWAGIKEAAGTTWAAIGESISTTTQSTRTWLEGAWGKIADFLGRTWEGIKKGAGDIWKGVANTVIGFINKIIDAVNGMVRQLNRLKFDVPKWVPVFGGKSWGFEIPDIGAQLEEMKPTLAGFWEWIKQGAGNLWDGVKVKWQVFKDWAANTWAGQLWQGIKDKWGGFKGWAGNLWDGTKEKWGGFTDWVGNKWDGFKTKSKEIWDGVKTNVQKSWESLKTNAPIVWGGIKTNIETSWNTLSTGAKKTWGNIKSTVQSSWDALKKDAPAVWESIKSTIATKTSSARDTLKKTWDEVSKHTSKTWADIKTRSSTVWDGIKSYLSQTWSGIQTTAGNTFANVKTKTINAWNDIKNRAPGIWGNIKNSITNPIESAKRTLLNIVNTIKNAFNNMRITIPKPKLPHVSVSTKTKTIGGISIPYPDFDVNWYAQGGVFNSPSMIGVGEAGAEAVLPLERNTGWMDTLAAKIAASIPGGSAGGDIYVYVGNEQVDAYVYRSQDRRNVKSNGR